MTQHSNRDIKKEKRRAFGVHMMGEHWWLKGFTDWARPREPREALEAQS